MTDFQFPAGMRELDFLDAYRNSALRKPSVVADSALRSLVLASQVDRLVLAGLIAEQLAEACRRLTHVWQALADRRYSVARTLAGPLPGVAAFRSLAQDAGTLSSEQVLHHLSLDSSAIEFAEKLRGQPALAMLDELVATAEVGAPMLLIPSLSNGRSPTEGWLAGVGPAGEVTDALVGLQEPDAASMADTTADLCSVARGFLGVYLGARRGAGRPV